MTKTASVERKIHFVLRYSDELHGHDTIQEHLKVLNECGHVWMGKFGLGIRSDLVGKINAQVQALSPTYLYLHSRSKIRFRCPLQEVVGGGVSARLPTPERSATPPYYEQRTCAVWFKISAIEDCSLDDIAAMRLYNDPSLTPTFVSMRGLFYVTLSFDGGDKSQTGQPRTKRRKEKTDVSLLDDEDW